MKSLKANIVLSLAVAITGIVLPIGLSFILRFLTNATPIQSFAAGAALCSTSLGTTFTVLGTSGLVQSRLGVVLTSAAMMDDVVGLVMVEVISKLGKTVTSIGVITVVRPILVSLALVAIIPLICLFLVKPVTTGLNTWRKSVLAGYADRLLGAKHTPFTIHTLILLGCITGASYAGTSTLFAAYIAGASISWWDSELPHPAPRNEIATDAATNNTESSAHASNETDNPSPLPRLSTIGLSGVEVYEQYFLIPVNRVLRPFFFVSIVSICSLVPRTNAQVGIHWLLDSHHRNVRGKHCLERSSIYFTDDVWQDLLRYLAYASHCSVQAPRESNNKSPSYIASHRVMLRVESQTRETSIYSFASPDQQYTHQHSRLCSRLCRSSDDPCRQFNGTKIGKFSR